MGDIAVFFSSHSGELIALSVAALWGIGSVIYTSVGKTIPPIELNWIKNGVGFLLFLIIIIIQGGINTHPSLRAYTFQFISGAVGIGLGDTAYFSALQLIGARKASLVKILAPPLAGWIAFFMIHESMSALSWIGTFVTILGVALVVLDPVISSPDINSKQNNVQMVKGICLGIFAAASEALGVVLSHAAMTQSTTTPAQSAGTRLLAGFIITSLIIYFSRFKIFQWINLPKKGEVIMYAGAAIFMGTFIGVWLQQIALQYIAAGIAQTLIATSPVFVLVITALLGERITIRNVLGIVCSTLGIMLFFL